MDSLKNLSKAPRSPKKYISDIVREKVIKFKREKPSFADISKKKIVKIKI